jgi:hypothetical protein
MSRHGRGNWKDRMRRRKWLLSPDAPFGGDGEQTPCFWCESPVTYDTLSVDRWPYCGHEGGGYNRLNIVPSCDPCNIHRCGHRGESLHWSHLVLKGV